MTDPEALDALTIGDFAPNFVLPDAAGKVTMLMERTRGRPVALVLLASGPDPARAIAALAAFHPEALAAGVDLMAVCPAPADAPPPFHLWLDPQGKVLGAFREALSRATDAAGGAAAPISLVLALDPNQRLEAVCPAASRPGAMERALRAALAVLNPTDARRRAPGLRARKATAPVVGLRRLLAEAECSRLATLGAAVVPGIPATDPWPDPALDAAQSALGLTGEGRPVAVYDSATARDLQIIIGKRLAVQLEKAFQFRDFHLLPPRLVGVPARSGIGPAVRLAGLSGWPPRIGFIALVSLGSAGSGRLALTFPEYGRRKHCLSGGDALIFSTSITVTQPIGTGREQPALLLAVARRAASVA